MSKGKTQVLDNKTELYQIYGWFKIGKDKKRQWYLFAQGSEKGMFAVYKAHITMMAEVTKDSVAFMGLLASYLVLSPQNEIVEIPPFYEIKPKRSEPGKDDERIDHNMKVLDELTRTFKKPTIIYEGRVTVKSV